MVARIIQDVLAFSALWFHQRAAQVAKRLGD